MRRRDFLRTAAASGASLAASPWLIPAFADGKAPSTKPAQLPMRKFGRHDDKLSIIGFPGFALKEVEMDIVKSVVAQACEIGMNYFDVAPQYGDAEERLGPALVPYRKKVFLACKTHQRKAAEARAELERSLKRLKTDHFDLYQLHHITDVKNDVDVAFAKGGAMEVLIEAKKAGLVKYLGFSAHSVEAALTAMDRYDFDSALVPINFACCFKGNFGPQIIEHAQKKRVALLAIKPFARQKWPKDDKQRDEWKRLWYQPLLDPDETELSVRFTLSQPVVAAIPPADIRFIRQAIELGTSFKPITPPETETLRELAHNLSPVFSYNA